MFRKKKKEETIETSTIAFLLLAERGISDLLIKRFDKWFILTGEDDDERCIIKMSKWNILFIFGSFRERERERISFSNIGENLLRVIKKIDKDRKIERKAREKRSGNKNFQRSDIKISSIADETRRNIVSMMYNIIDSIVRKEVSGL